MLLGMNMLLWTTRVTAAHHGLLEHIKSVGFDGIELPIFSGKPAEYSELGKMLIDLGLRTNGVAVMPDETKSLIHSDVGVRQAGVDHVKWAIDCLHAANGEVLCGPIHQTLGTFSGVAPTANEIDHLVETSLQIADYASQAGIVLAVEPLNRFEAYVLNTCAQSRELVDRVNHPSYGFLYDTFHANIEEADPIAEISISNDQITHVHLSENHRGTPGRGHVRWNETLAAFRKQGYNGWFVVEAFGRAEPEIAAATRVWRPLSPSAQDVVEFGHDFLRHCYEAAK